MQENIDNPLFYMIYHCKITEVIMNLISKLKSFAEFDLIAYLVKTYRNIPTIYKKTFWTVFIVLNIVFAFHTINFFWSNHEWPLMKGHISPTNFWWEARFTETLLYFLMDFRILPVLMNLFSFFGLSLSVVLLAIYWNIPKKQSNYICFGLITALMPYNLIWLYHVAQSSYFWGTACIILSLMLFEKKQNKHVVLWSIPLILLLFFVLGLNASFINTISICIIGRYFFKFINGEKITSLCKELSILFADIVGAVCLLKLAIISADKYGILNSDFYNVQHISITEIPAKLLTIIPYMYQQFTQTYPFVDATLLRFLLILSAWALSLALWQSTKSRGFLLGIIGFIGLVFGLLLASQLTTLVSTGTDIQFWLRVSGYFGHYYIFSLMLAMLYCFCKKGIWRNLLFVGTVVLIMFNIQRDMYAMRVWKQGRDAEDKIMDRIMARIEQVDGFNYNQRYGIALLGDISMRPRYYDTPMNNNDVSVLGWSWRAPWETQNYFNFYAPSDFVAVNYNNYWNLEFIDRLLPVISVDTMKFIQSKAKAWPDINSVFIRDNIIFVILDPQLLYEFKQGIAKYLRQNPILDNPQKLNLYHPRWENQFDYVEFITEDRVIHNTMNTAATVESITNDRVILMWDCCGRETFVKNADGVYEFLPQ